MTEQEFERLVEPCKKPFQNYAYRMRLCTEDAKDLWAVAVAHAWAKREHFKVDRNFTGWFMRLAQNKVKDWFRYKSKRPHTISTECAAVSNLNKAFSDYNFLEEYSEDKNVTESLEVIDLLDVFSQEDNPLLECLTSEMSYKDIADKFDIPIGTVRSRVFKYRKELFEKYGEVLQLV